MTGVRNSPTTAKSCCLAHNPAFSSFPTSRKMAASSSTTHYGIRFGVFQRLVKESAYLKEGHPEATTKEFVDNYLKPLLEKTLKGKCAFVNAIDYVDQLQDKSTDYYFISHTWGCPIAKLVAALEEHFAAVCANTGAKLDDCAVWLDFLMVNQCGDNSAEVNTVFELLPQAIAQARQTVMVVDVHGTIFTRAWCVYEVWNTVTLPAREDTSANSGDPWSTSRLVMLLTLISPADLERTCATIDVDACGTFRPEDKERIVKKIRSVFPKVHQFESVIYDGLQTSAKRALELLGDSLASMDRKQRRTAYLRCSIFHQLGGNIQEAVKLVEKAKKLEEEPQQPTTEPGPLDTEELCLMARTLTLFKVPNALDLWRRAEIMVAAVDVNTCADLGQLLTYLEVKVGLGEAFYATKQNAEAYLCFQAVTAPALWDTNLAYANAIRKVAAAKAIRAARKPDEKSTTTPKAEWEAQALEKAINRLHEQRFMAHHWLGRLDLDHGKYSAAEENFNMSLSQQEQVLGNAPNLYTMETCKHYGRLLTYMEKWQEAELQLDKALALAESMPPFYTEHKDMEVASVNEHRASLFERRGRFSEALPLRSAAIATTSSYYGSKHTKVARCLGRLGQLLVDMGRYNEAIASLREAIDIDATSMEKEQYNAALRKIYLARGLTAQLRFDTVASAQQREAIAAEAKDLYTSSLPFIGRDHDQKARALVSYARLLAVVGNRDQAIRTCKEALEICQARKVKQQDANEAEMLLGDIHYLLADISTTDSEAQGHATKSLAHYEKSVGADHIATLRCQLLIDRRFQHNAERINNLLQRMEAILGSEHPEVVFEKSRYPV